MKVTLTAIAARRGRTKTGQADAIAAQYIERVMQYAAAEAQTFETEAALLAWLAAPPGRTRPVVILLDSRGRQLSSEQFAEHLGQLRDSGAQHLVLAIGPPDGWSAAARERANLLLSLGPMTLPHHLARAVLAEQVYRAFTILAGHPYHSGH